MASEMSAQFPRPQVEIALSKRRSSSTVQVFFESSCTMKPTSESSSPSSFLGLEGLDLSSFLGLEVVDLSYVDYISFR